MIEIIFLIFSSSILFLYLFFVIYIIASLYKQEYPSKKAQLKLVKESAWYIKYIKNPSEEVQLAAVIQFGEVICYIKNPSKKVQLAAVKKYGGAIQYIKAPSKKLQLKAIGQCPMILNHIYDYIKNPCQEVLDLAMIKDIIE